MKRVYIFGTGKGKLYVNRCLIRNEIEILGYIDNYKANMVRKYEGIPVIKQNELDKDFDYIIVSLMQYDNVEEQLLNQGIEQSKIICFFKLSDVDNEEYWSVLDSFKWKVELVWKHYKSITIPTIDNLNYELYRDSLVVQKDCPKIIDVEHTVEILKNKKKCLARFGDNEFELMCGRVKTNYQMTDIKLEKRLKEVLHSEMDNLMVAIADNYGSLDKYTDDAAKDIRSYLTKEVRQDHIRLLDMNKQYYDAYLSRPYIIYRDKKNAADRFENIKSLWRREDVLIVEGEYTRFGVGNDLLEGALSISRLLVPGKNAFSEYDKILKAVRKYGKEKLILVILGPTATVMAYDLARESYWVVDIGQLDVEYEWYLRGVTKRCNIPYKCVSEVLQYNDIVTDENQDYIRRYNDEIIERIL